MPYHFPLIREALRADIVVALESLGEAKVLFGQPTKPIRSYPHAVVRSVVGREIEGRSVEEGYSFEIELRLPPYDPQATDRETYLYDYADRLIQRLAPFDPDAPPSPAPDYAGVGYGREVGEVTPGDDKDTDAFVSVRLAFSVAATVYQ